MDQHDGEALKGLTVCGATKPCNISGFEPSQLAEGNDFEMIQAARILTSDMASDHSTGGMQHPGYTSTEQSDAIQEFARQVAQEEPQEETVQPYVEYDEDELLPLEYARYYGLTKDFFLEHLLPCTQPPSPEHLQADLRDPDSTLNVALLVSLGALEGHTVHGRWDVDKESAKFLASVLALCKEENWQDGSASGGALKLKDLKLEEPILVSDPELDLEQLRHRNMITISTDGIEPFKLDENKNEGFSWTPEDLRLPSGKDRSVAHERLDIDHETIEVLKEISTAPCLDEKAFAQALSEGHRVAYPTPVTPPLMPLSPPVHLGGLSDAAGELPFASTPEDLIAMEAANMKRQILERDRTPPNSTAAKLEPQDPDKDTTSIYTLLQSKTDSTSSPVPQKRLQDLKAEVPLTPQDGIERPTKKAKTVSFPKELPSMVPPPESDMSVLDQDLAQQDLDEFFAEVSEPFADLATQQIKNEELVELDTTMRVAVPQVQEFELLPPWKVVCKSETEASRLQVLQVFLSQTKRELLSSETTWSGVSKTERLLPWSPFPARLGRMELNEVFDDGSFARYMADLTVNDDIDVDALITKPLGPKWTKDHDEELPLELTAFDNEEETQRASPASKTLLSVNYDQSIVPGTSATEKVTEFVPGRLDMQTLLRKRKLEIDSVDDTNNQPFGPDLVKIVDHVGTKPCGPVVAESSRFGDLRISGGISSFMNLHDGPSRHASISTTSEQRQKTTSPAVGIPSMAMETTLTKPTKKVLPAPNIVPAAMSVPIVVSSSLLANRELIRQVQSTLPGVELIARDPTQSSMGGSVKEQNKGQEADITVSPITGLIMTTLQKVKQKPLPGQATFFGVYERVALLSLRYTRLLVLVSEAHQQNDDDDAGPAAMLDERDTQALSDLMGFVATLTSDVVVYYVAGGDAQLAGWLAALISHHAVLDGNAALLQDETLWEQFLRSAGLNPCAAQNILAKLKLPETIQGGDSSSVSGGSGVATHGLAAFMQMSTSQRVEKFSQEVGENVLASINNVVERRWM